VHCLKYYDGAKSTSAGDCSEQKSIILKPMKREKNKELQEDRRRISHRNMLFCAGIRKAKFEFTPLPRRLL